MYIQLLGISNEFGGIRMGLRVNITRGLGTNYINISHESKAERSSEAVI